MSNRTPSKQATTITTPQTAELEPQEVAVFTFEPKRSGSSIYTTVVAVSKRSDTAYTIEMDDQPVWGPSAIPPTDIDDTSPVFIPAREAEYKIEVRVEDLRTKGSKREYHALPVGWEE